MVMISVVMLEAVSFFMTTDNKTKTLCTLINHQERWYTKCHQGEESKVEIESYKFQGPSGFSLRAVSLCLPKGQLWLNRINTESSGDFLKETDSVGPIQVSLKYTLWGYCLRICIFRKWTHLVQLLSSLRSQTKWLLPFVALHEESTLPQLPTPWVQATSNDWLMSGQRPHMPTPVKRITEGIIIAIDLPLSLDAFLTPSQVLLPGEFLNKMYIYIYYIHIYMHMFSSSVQWEGLIAVTSQKQCAYLIPTFWLPNFILNSEEWELLREMTDSRAGEEII